MVILNSNLALRTRLALSTRHITNNNSRELNLFVTGYPISVANFLDDFKKLLSDQLHLIDDLITNYTHPATIRVISDNNTASHRDLATYIVSLNSVTVRNSILSVGKRLKGTDFYIYQDLPKAVKESHKLLQPFFLDARANNKKCTYIGTRWRIDNTIFEVNDTASLTIRYPHAADKPQSLNS